MKRWEMDERGIVWILIFVMVLVNLPVFMLKVNAEKAAYGYEIPAEAYAACGAELSEVSLKTKDGTVQWMNEKEILWEGEKTVEAKFIPYDGTAPQKIEVKVIVEHANKNIHDLDKMPETYLIHMSYKPDTPATEEQPGNYGYLKCDNCGKYFDMEGNEHELSWFTKPYVVKNISVTLGEKIELDKLVKNGQEVIDGGIDLDDKDTYGITVDEKNKKISIVTRKKLKSYKKKLKNPTIILKDKAGKSHLVEAEVKIPKPTKKQVKIRRKKLTLAGITGYKYTIKYNVKDAKNLTINVASGAFNKRGQKKINKDLKARVKKSKGTAVLMIRKIDMKKDKITFNIVVNYGNGNKSETLAITE